MFEKCMYNYLNTYEELVCVMRCDAIYENDREYTIAFFCVKTGQFISRMTRSFVTVEEAQLYLDVLAVKNEWKYAEV